MNGTVLITGTTGYIGRQLAARLLATTDDRLLLTVRTAVQGPDLLHALGPAAATRADLAVTDLTTDDPFAGIDPRPVTHIVHAAALTAFNADFDRAHAVNVGGTSAVTRFARRCPRLQRLLVVSTLYSAGRRTGLVSELPHDSETDYANHYERSKAQAEAHLFGDCADLPLSVARLATVIADGDDGRVRQFNAFHNTLKLFFYGLMSLMPGDPQTPLYLATADFTTAGAQRLLSQGVLGGIYHLSPGTAEAITLGDLIDVVFDSFDTDPGFRRRRLLRPQWCDRETFNDLAKASRSLSRSPLAQALDSVVPFADQMFLPKQFSTGRLDTAWPDRPRTDPRALVQATTAYLLHTRWGRDAKETP